MVRIPLPSPPVRGGWRVGLLVFGCAALAAAAFTLAPLLWQVSGQREPGDKAGGTSPDNRADAAFSRKVTTSVSAVTPVARHAVTNLAPVSGAARAVTATNALVAMRGVSGAGSRTSAVSRTARSGRELPVFAALRASRSQPIPKEVAELAREITRNSKTDAERARAIYDWMTSHITYDWKVWADIVAGAGTYTQPQDPLSVLQRGTGVCAGYAWLFDALAASAGLNTTFIIGDVRGYRGTADDDLISKYQHAWNSVQVGDQWYLLDSTWGARQDGEPATDYLARRDYYYQTPPDQMIFDHLPESADWQLLSNPLEAEAFRDLPNLKPAFFRDGLRLGNAFSDAIATPTGKPAVVTLAAPEGILLGATLSCNGQDISASHVSIIESGIRRDVVVGALPAGDYILRIYSKPATAAGPFDCAADYALTVGGP
jgi:transglutaminase-like putative cysteine protease